MRRYESGKKDNNRARMPGGACSGKSVVLSRSHVIQTSPHHKQLPTTVVKSKRTSLSKIISGFPTFEAVSCLKSAFIFPN